MPRRQYRYSRVSIHKKVSESWGRLEPTFAPILTDAQVRQKRLELAEELLGLVLGEGELGKQPRQTLERIHASLGSVRRLL